MSRGRTLLRILMHGFFLVVLNLFSIVFSIIVFRSVSFTEGGILHGVTLVTINLVIYLLVLLLMKGMKTDVMDVDDFSMLAGILMISLALLPVFYHPMFYLVKGYWSSFGNLTLVWSFQIVANGLSLVFNRYWLNKT